MPGGSAPWPDGGAGARHRRARRALERQLAYQRAKAATLAGHEAEYVVRMRAGATRVRGLLGTIRPIAPDARVVEVGSGAHGLIFYFGTTRGVGCDPLAADYVRLYPAWQRRVPTLAALGERLPFPDGTFDVALCDNVVDHAEDPARIVAELVRVLAPGGLLYFTVNVHHPIYSLISRLHAAWNAIGLRLEIGPFADHTVHLTPEAARRLFDALPVRLLVARGDPAEATARARSMPARHVGDRLKRVFFKNARYEVVAVRRP